MLSIPQNPAPRLHFGGPDLPPRALRDLLCARIKAVPAGGEIVWATYYFRDRDLARALMAASDRGARVTLHVEGAPRRKSANAPVLALLAEHGLKGGLHVHKPGLIPKLHPHLHSKIYYFSHPAPHALVGSFNPSGDAPEDLDVIAEIGDQDRGHNMLVELAEPALAAGLRTRVLGLKRPLLRWRLSQQGALKGGSTMAWSYPRLAPGVMHRALSRLGAGCRVSGAISHLKQGALMEALMRAAVKGAEVRLLVHDTQRRVPQKAVDRLRRAGVSVRRFVHEEHLPLHAKFLLVEEPHKRTAWFGSFNYNPRSNWLNHEVLLASSHPVILDGLAQRFEEIRRATPAEQWTLAAQPKPARLPASACLLALMTRIPVPLLAAGELAFLLPFSFSEFL